MSSFGRGLGKVVRESYPPSRKDRNESEYHISPTRRYYRRGSGGASPRVREVSPRGYMFMKPVACRNSEEGRNRVSMEYMRQDRGDDSDRRPICRERMMRYDNGYNVEEKFYSFHDDESRSQYYRAHGSPYRPSYEDRRSSGSGRGDHRSMHRSRLSGERDTNWQVVLTRHNVCYIKTWCYCECLGDADVVFHGMPNCDTKCNRGS